MSSGGSWRVTGLDVSRVALTRARAAARSRGLSVEWVCAPLVDLRPAVGGYDDPADYVQPPGVAARLGDGWLVEVNQERPRVGP